MNFNQESRPGPMLPPPGRSIAAPFLAAVVLLVFALAWLAVEFRETHPAQPGKPLRIGRAFANLTSVFTDVPVRRLYLVNFLCGLAIFWFYRCILMYMTDEWQMPAERSTLVYSWLAVTSGIANLLCLGPLSRSLGLERLAVIAGLVGGVLTIAIVLPDSENSLWFTAGATSFVAVLLLSTCAVMLSNATSADRQGSVMGNNAALMVASQALSSVGGGLLAAVWVPFPLVVAGGLFMATALMVRTMSEPGAARLPVRAASS
jgi:predicted MFS family arabinose efflux permease